MTFPLSKDTMQDLRVDGHPLGEVTSIQITCNAEAQAASIIYLVNGQRRELSCELEAISFG